MFVFQAPTPRRPPPCQIITGLPMMTFLGTYDYDESQRIPLPFLTSPVFATSFSTSKISKRCLQRLIEKYDPFFRKRSFSHSPVGAPHQFRKLLIASFLGSSCFSFHNLDFFLLRCPSSDRAMRRECLAMQILFFPSPFDPPPLHSVLHLFDCFSSPYVSRFIHPITCAFKVTIEEGFLFEFVPGRFPPPSGFPPSPALFSLPSLPFPLVLPSYLVL